MASNEEHNVIAYSYEIDLRDKLYTVFQKKRQKERALMGIIPPRRIVMSYFPPVSSV
jgi:hypothetical protein